MLKNSLIEDLVKYKIDLDTFQKYMLYQIEKKITKLKEDNYGELKIISSDNFYNIDIFSPCFEIFKKNDFFEIFRVLISINFIKNNNLKDNYISFFNKLNELNLNYPILFLSIKNPDDINFLQELNINFNSIKKLIIFPENNKKENYENFFKTLFSLNGLENNLDYLECYRIDDFDRENSFEKLNDYKSLKYLKLTGFSFKNNFILKNNLTHLYLVECINISFNENDDYDLEYIYFSKCLFNKPNKLIKFPKLIILNIY